MYFYQVTGRCQFSQLQNFISTAVGIQTTGQSSIRQPANDQTTVLNGSFILFSCVNGYFNAGGSLNLTCGNNGMWTPFPNCVQSSGGGAMTTMSSGSGAIPTTTIPTSSGGAGCLYDEPRMITLDNGFRTASAITYLTQNTVTGLFLSISVKQDVVRYLSQDQSNLTAYLVLCLIQVSVQLRSVTTDSGPRNHDA